MEGADTLGVRFLVLAPQVEHVASQDDVRDAAAQIRGAAARTFLPLLPRQHLRPPALMVVEFYRHGCLPTPRTSYATTGYSTGAMQPVGIFARVLHENLARGIGGGNDAWGQVLFYSTSSTLSCPMGGKGELITIRSEKGRCSPHPPHDGPLCL